MLKAFAMDPELPDTYRFEVHDDELNLSIIVSVDAAMALHSKDAQWWFDHGNDDMGRYMAKRWAKKEALAVGGQQIHAHARLRTLVVARNTL